MPFKSPAHRRFMHANHPEIAKRWEKEYPDKDALKRRLRRREKKNKK